MVSVSTSVAIRTKVHLWWTWLQIAARSAGEAQRARAGEVLARSFEAPESARLSIEFQSSLSTIAAVAFAMEALALELKGNGHVLDDTLFKKPPNTNAGFFIGNRLIQAFGLAGELAARLPSRLEALFQLRNDSVHFESQYRDGVHPHPSGTNTSYELTVFTFERCVEALALGFSVISECAASAKAQRFHQSAAPAIRELPGVLRMLREVIETEGLRGIE